MFHRFALLAALAGIVAGHEARGGVVAVAATKGEESAQAAAVAATEGETYERTTSFRSLVANPLQASAGARELATSVVLTFEGVGDNTPVGGYYNGAGGPNYGVVFGPSAWSTVDSDVGGSSYLANEPSPNSTLYFPNEYSDTTMTVSNGFTGLSFYYSSVWDMDIVVYDGPNGTGNTIATVPIPGMATRLDACNSNGTCGDPTCYYAVWDPLVVQFSGVAKSVRFTSAIGGIGYAYFDDVTIALVSLPPSRSPTTSPTKRPTPVNSIVLDFEGVGDNSQVGSYYNGAGGPNYGVVFDADTFAHGPGSGWRFANEPSSSTVVGLPLNGGGMTVEAGFTALSFYYSSYSDLLIDVYDGPTGTGNKLAADVLIPNLQNRIDSCNSNASCSDPSQGFSLTVWDLFSVPFIGVAKSVYISAVDLNLYYAYFDDVIITPVSLPPSKPPTKSPSKSPTESPTKQPSKPPTKSPTKSPTKQPSKQPSKTPTKQPSKTPTKQPSKSPTKRPTKPPTKAPSKQPSKPPTKAPSKPPTTALTSQPAASPTKSPTTTSTSTTIVLDFEGVDDDTDVGSFYDGVGGPNYGVVFGHSASAFVDDDNNGNGDFANEPSPNTTMFFYGEYDTSMTVKAGFVGLSFYYSSYYNLFITVYSGPNGTGAVLATVPIPRTGICGVDFPACGDPTGRYGNWSKFPVPFSGVAKSVRFLGDAPGHLDEYAYFDDMTITLASVLPSTKSPTKRPTKRPTKLPTKRPAPTTPRCTKTTYWLWNPRTNKRIGALKNNSASCIAVPYNIEVRPCTIPKKLPVIITLQNTTRAVIKTQKDYVAPYYLWGDKTSTKDVFPNTKPLRKGTYYLTSNIGGKVEKIKFTKTC